MAQAQPIASTVTDADPSTPAGPDDGPLADLDTARLRNLVARRVFGEVLEPVRIGRFPILRRIGQGGMGVVYAAYDNELDRKIAIKLLRRGGESGDDGERRRRRLLREAKALARLSHPGIVAVYEIGEHEERVWIAMEFVDGPTLRRWLELGSRDVGEILAMYVQAGRGLAAAHAAGMVHRDFKPDNAIVGPDGRVRVLDFGVASLEASAAIDDGDRPAAAMDPVATATRGPVGTPAYMAPEQLEGGDIDARTDQFSFAVALFEALYGARPFVGATMTEVLAAMARGTLTVPSGRRVPSRVLAALRRALAPDPAQRFASMDELLARLQPRARRSVLGLGVAAAALTGAALWSNARTEELSAAAAAAEQRVAEAEAELVVRDEAILIARANNDLTRDPDLALADLLSLPVDSPHWDGAAWQVAAKAIDLGIASELFELPEGFSAVGFRGDAVLLAREGMEALWYPETGALRVLTSGGEGPVDVSRDGQWLARMRGLQLTVGHLGDDVEGRIDVGMCVFVRIDETSRTVVVSCLDAQHKPQYVRLGWDRPAGASTLDLRRLPDERDVPGTSPMVLSRGDDVTAFVTQVRGRELELQIRDDRTGRMQTLIEHASTLSMEFGHTRRVAFFIRGDGALYTFDPTAERIQPTFVTGLTDSFQQIVRLSPDDRRLCVLEPDGVVGVFSVETGARLASLRGVASPRDLRIAADGSIAVLGDGHIRRYAARSDGLLDDDAARVFGGPGQLGLLHRDGRIERIGVDGVRTDVLTVPDARSRSTEIAAFDRSGRRIATSGERELAVRDLASGRVELELATRDQGVGDLMFAPTADLIAWLDENEIRARSIDGALARAFPAPASGWWATMMFVGDELVAAHLDEERTVGSLVWIDVERGTLSEPIGLPLRRVTAMAVLTDGRLALADADGRLIVTDARGAQARVLLEGGPMIIEVVAVGGPGLAVLEADGSVSLWDADTGTAYRTPGAEVLGIARQGQPSRVSLTAVDGTLLVVDEHSRARLYRVPLPWDREGRAARVAELAHVELASSRSPELARND